AMAENFFSILKTECIYRHKPATFAEANEMIDRYICFYNHERIQLKTGEAPLARHLSVSKKSFRHAVRILKLSKKVSKSCLIERAVGFLPPAHTPRCSVSSVFCGVFQQSENVIMIGNPGRGKTHLSIALGLKACTRGYNVLFKNAATLSTELCEAKDNYHLGKLERTLAKADLLILDELSYLSFNRHQSELLFKVISDRSEKSSTIVTTNLPFSKWTELFENTTMVAALIDRLTFRSHVLDMNGDSYRLKATMQKRA